jgi:hypothetical protein
MQPKSVTTNPLLGKWDRCGWCGSHMPEAELKDHEQYRCEAMLEEFQRECEHDQRRQLENQLWEEEHAAGRI